MEMHDDTATLESGLSVSSKVKYTLTTYPETYVLTQEEGKYTSIQNPGPECS